MRTFNNITSSILTKDELYFLRGGVDTPGPGDAELETDEIDIPDITV